MRGPELWNKATDFAINPLLIIANGFTLAAGTLIDSAFDNLSVEEIYARLLQNTTGAGPCQTDQELAAGGGTSGTATAATGNGTGNRGAPHKR